MPSLELTEEEKEDMSDLEARLKIYREFKAAEKNIKALWSKKVSYSRDFLLETEQGFYLSQEIRPQDLLNFVKGLCDEFIAVLPKLEQGQIKLINFEEKIKELLDRVTRATSSSFKEIAKGKDRTEIVVIFLAILHLLKDSRIKVRQETEFADIKMETPVLN